MSGKTSIKTGIIGADTSFLIDFFRGNVSAVEYMRSHAKLLRVSELVIYEFLCGNLKDKEVDLFFDAMQSFSTVPFNREAAILASQLYRDAKKTGKTVGHQDCMIAGSYLAHGAQRVVTSNKGHFKNMGDVQVIGY